MQIILLEKIANVGNLGDVVKVKDGFARNYLIPKGMAKRATPENLKLIEGKRAEFEAASRRPLATRLRYAFIHTYMSVLDDATLTRFDDRARIEMGRHLISAWTMADRPSPGS